MPKKIDPAVRERVMRMIAEPLTVYGCPLTAVTSRG